MAQTQSPQVTSVLVTGSSGMVGGALLRRLAGQYQLVSLSRRPPAVANIHHINADFSEPQWLQPLLPVLGTVKVIVHCAARVHQMQDNAQDASAQYQAINTQASLELARAAAKAGVKRFIFISTIKVNGEFSEPGKPFTAADTPAPADEYAKSKWQAEQGLWQLSRELGMEVVIIRPPLVYGPGVKANFSALANLVRRGVPLPLAKVDNKRSLVALDNLLSLIECCIEHPAAAGQTFLVSDNDDLSTADLVQLMARVLQVKARLLPVPVTLLKLLFRLLGKTAQYQRLTGSLQLDISATCQRLNWQPPLSSEVAVAKALQN